MTDIETIQTELRVQETLSAMTVRPIVDGAVIDRILNLIFYGGPIAFGVVVVWLIEGEIPTPIPTIETTAFTIVAALLAVWFVYDLRLTLKNAVLFTINDQTLTLGERTVSLEDVQDITVVTTGDDRVLAFRLAEETIHRPLLASPTVSAALVRLLRRHVQRRKDALAAALNQTVPPASLQKLRS